MMAKAIFSSYTIYSNVLKLVQNNLTVSYIYISLMNMNNNSATSLIDDIIDSLVNKLIIVNLDK